ncbi:MAG: VCBS repeat-containing protein [Tannerella sp.]|jgi:pyrimidine deaminase RibD-like protein|nr:VCBS repeat-containing protein [Tannerella sp.]
MEIRNTKKALGAGALVLSLMILGFGLRMRAAADRFSASVEASSVQPDTLPAVKPLEFSARQFTLAEQEAPSGIPLLRAAPYPTGYVDSTLLRCFVDMSTVNFSPEELFWQQSGSGTTDRLYGFSVPLVGDLNGDGKAEIVALGYNGTTVNAESEYLYIFNGQTGAVLKKFTLPVTVEPCYSGYHGSPCQLALVDADKNGLAEIIVCFNHSSYTSSILTKYKKQTASFEVDYAFNLVEKWCTTVRYDAWSLDNSGRANGLERNYDYPIPQIVDIDENNTPELIVYNKIYNAATGAYIMKLQESGFNPGHVTKTAYIGSFCLEPIAGYDDTYNDTYYESSIAFPAIYDIDSDGKYDYIAGGKIYYNIDLTNKTYSIYEKTGIPDGRTAVADIDGDGKPEVVVQTCDVINQYSRFDFTLTVWKPDFSNPSNPTATTVATRTFRAYNSSVQGYSSHLYIGDIDGKVQNGKKLPEISLICGRPFKSGTSVDRDMVNIPVHPNVTDGLITPNKTLSSTSVEGCLVSFTWDDNASVASDRLKVSFMLEHEDRSINTGFSLFDFDNDGTAEICYRDEQTLRIISATKSFVTIGETDTDVIRMKKDCHSFTGFEYPAIADVDADGSADMVVMGRSNNVTDNAAGFILVVSGANRDLAPAPAVWNQFHYHPMKINENLRTPSPNFHPLDDDYKFYKTDADANPIYIYNSNIMQAVISSGFEAANGKEVIKPIVRTPDAKIIDARITPASGGTVIFKVTNTGDATLPPTTPLRIYQGEGSSATLITNVTIAAMRPTGLYRGDTIEYSYSAGISASNVYHIIVGGTLDSNGELQPDNIRECHWPDNYAIVALFLPREDLATVPLYGTVVIDVFANDILESPCDNQTLTAGMITTPGGVGVLSGFFGNIQIINNKIVYTAPGPLSLPPLSEYRRVMHFSYKLSCESNERTANVYIFLLESCTESFETCAGSNYTVCLKTEPATGVSFRWYRSDNTTYLGQTPPTINNATTDTTFYVKPDFSGATTAPWNQYRTKDFPTGKLTITVLGASGIDTARWTGMVDRDWFNPGNWVQIKNGKSKAVTWAPNNDCVDVILGENCPHYPELKDIQVKCRNIHLENRAMIAGIHKLTYDRVSIDFEPVSTEKDRFVMWSAPLKDMYTGDYHFPKADGSPDWGLVYMNFFQSANPDISGSVASERTYTATFGNMGESLSLGKAFNINILPDTEGKRFTFPKASRTLYTGANGANTATLSRGNAWRFITDGVLNNSNGGLNIPVNSNFPLIQVVNPFAAYLKVNEFLSANSSLIEDSYKIWDGNVDYRIDTDNNFIFKHDFVTMLSTGDTVRYWINDASDPELTGSEALIAPFQAFFVTKKTSAGLFNTLTMNTSMTTTVGPSAKFTLRSSAAEEGVLRITAKQQSYRNSTALLNEAGADPSYDPDEDSRKAFLDGVPVSIYTLASGNEALAINRSGDFDAPVWLGIRLRNTGLPVTLDFSGLERFGRPVYLIDHEQDGRETDLQRQPSYTFVVRSGMNGGGVTELNDRFSLRFGAPAGTAQVEDSDIRVYAGESSIYIDFPDGALYSVTIYNVLGSTVYQGKASGPQIVVPVPPNQLYFVKTHTGNKDHPIRKVLVSP